MTISVESTGVIDSTHYYTAFLRSEAELSKATELRKSENADFVASEKELLGTVDSLERSAAFVSQRGGALEMWRKL